MAVKDDELDLDNIVEHDDDADLANADRGDALTVDDEPDGGDKAKDVSAGDKENEGDATDDDSGEAKEPSKKAPEPEADDPPDDKDVPNPMVPRARLTESQRKRREAEARAAELETELQELRNEGGQNKAFKEFTDKVDKLYEDVELARAEGDYKKAAGLQRELDKMRDGANRANVEYLTKQRAAQAQDLAAYEAVVDQVELLVPELSPDHDDFDQDLLADVSATRDGYEAHGMKPAAALKKALKLVLGRDVFATPTKDLRREDKPPEKKATDLKKNIAAIKKQPPDTDAAAPAELAKTIDVSKLTDEEFDKLPDAVRKRLRGDFV